jgi:hypothetical protein
MAARHEKVTVADLRLPGVRCATMDRHVFAKGIVITNVEAGGLVLILEVLRTFPEYDAREDDIAAAHAQRAAEVDVRPQDAAGSDTHLSLDDYTGSDLDIIR